MLPDASPLWMPILFLMAFAIAYLILKIWPFYRDQDFLSVRFGHIDGLRGYLAFSVFVTHLFSVLRWQLTGEWGYPNSIVYQIASSAPVSLFFMITGFLFWNKAIRANGRIDWLNLYSNRLRRLAPLYLAILPVLFVLVGFRSRWTIEVPVIDLILSIGRWCALGILGTPKINGIDQTFVFHPAVWTLRYEWMFYLALPILAYMHKPTKAVALGITTIAVSLLFNKPIVINFVFGAFTAYFLQNGLAPALLKGRSAALLAVASLVATALTGFWSYSLPQTLLLFPLFAVTCCGNNLFGLLSNRCAQFLGLISYSIYLVHVLAVHVCMMFLGNFHTVDAITLPIICCVVVLCSAFTYRFIEYPWIRKPKPQIELGDALTGHPRSEFRSC